ncbi:MAG TPA: TonB-dependent vitamin B12 receptor [Rhodanobacteraceae bacterium]
MKVPCGWVGPCAIIALTCAPVVAFASSTPTTLSQIVVTATGTAQTEDATLAPVTVITRADIDRLQPPTLQALLNDTPGMAIANDGGPGAATSLFLRGTNANQVLILVDGVRMGSVTTGTAAIQNIPINQIQRIEIVRGPFSSLYGADAIGGVIQIFLRHTPGTFVPNASVGVGSYSHWLASSGFSAASKQGWISVQAGHNQTDGIPGCRDGAAALFVACDADQPNRRFGYHNSSLTLNGAYTFNDRWSADGMAFRTQGFDDYAGTFSNSNTYSTDVLGGQLHYQPNQDLKLTLRAGESTDFESDFLNGAYVDTFDTRRSVATLQADIALAGGLLTVGLDGEREHLASNTVFPVDTRTNGGLFGEWQRSFGAQSVQVNLRHDQNSQFGGKTTGSALWGWNFTPTLRLTASYGTAFDTPTFNDLYFPGFGNPDLRPETSRQVDVGLRGTPQWGHWSVNAYRNNLNDLIVLNALTFLPSNVDRARITGIEGTVATRLAGWRLRATATVLDARDDDSSGSNDGDRLPRRPGASARFDADRAFGRFSIGASWELNSYAYDEIGNVDRLGGYSLVNLRAGWHINRDWQLQLALNNAFDKDYETAFFFNQPGRNWMLTLHFHPKQS